MGSLADHRGGSHLTFCIRTGFGAKGFAGDNKVRLREVLPTYHENSIHQFVCVLY